MNREVPAEWYDHIDSLVFEYQNGNSNAAEELVDIFKAYLNKYFTLIRDAKLNLGDRDSRRFIMLLIANPETRRRLIGHRQQSRIRAEAFRAASLLQWGCKIISDDDLQQELVIALLILAKRYKKRGKKNFAGYLYNAYRFEIYRRIMDFMRDPVAFSNRFNKSYNDDENITEYAEPELHFIDNDQLPEALGDELGSNWIYGITCSDLFADLTPFDRLILRLYYVDGLYEVEIAEKTGYHRNWISRRRHRAIQSIARRMQDESRYND
jgi:RNA polymerase sigma factor (sigma-70 family)